MSVSEIYILRCLPTIPLAGCALTPLFRWEKIANQRFPEENPGKGLSAGTFPAPGAVLDLFGQVVRFYQSYSPEFHTSARKNGRVATFAGNVVLNRKSTESYKNKVFKHIGKAKSGWLINTSYGWAARAPQWIARHGKNGTIKKLPDGSVEIENNLSYASEAMLKALVPFVQTKALQATNLKLHHEWQRRNRV